MNLQEIVEFVKLALVALRLNKLRSALTTLGIIIGVASVIVMAAIGRGATIAMEKQIASLGTNVLNVMPGSMRVGGRQLGFGGAQPFSEKDLRALREKVADIAAISGQLNGSINVVYGAANWSTTVNGMHAEYQDVRPWTLKSGRYFSAEEVDRGAKVAVLGSSVTRELFDTIDPVGEIVRINNIPFEIIGVLTTRGQSGGPTDPDDVVMVPLTTARSRLVGRMFATVPDTVGSLQVRVADGASLAAVQEQVASVLRRQRGIGAGQEDNFSIRNFAQLLQTRNAQSQTLSLLLAVTAAMSLVVGGIGIMNIMLVSVTERTREIGIRMAIGAREQDILAQFLLEAVMISLAGCLLGLLIGIGSALLVNAITSMVIVISGSSVLVAFGVAAAVGIFFGYYPAQKAARLDPIEALRYQ